MKNKRPVMRMCISCKVIQDRSNLLRITKDNNLGILFNYGTGRSAYICKTEICSKNVKLKKILQKALKIKIDSKIYEIIQIEIQNYK